MGFWSDEIRRRKLKRFGPLVRLHVPENAPAKQALAEARKPYKGLVVANLQPSWAQ